jgi:Tat protein secretion system quality control protein TatD with DNase activity
LNEAPQNFYPQAEALEEQLQWACAMILGLELHMVENADLQEMEEKAYEEQDSLLVAHQVYEFHLVGQKEIVLHFKGGLNEIEEKVF